MLYFEDDELDLFELELELLEIRRVIPERIKELNTKGRALFGGHQVVSLMTQELVQYRFSEWQRLRKEALQAIPEEQPQIPPQQPSPDER
jgi:hypothetical protein